MEAIAAMTGLRVSWAYGLAFGTLLPIAVSAARADDATSASAAGRYCAELRQVADLAASKARFASIAGKPRHGNYLSTNLPLPGWQDCSLYGPRTYTCDSAELPSREAAEAAQATTLREFKGCLGAGWSEAPDRSSPSYVVLHDARHPVSVTLSMDETEQKQHVVRVIIFRRSN
jgi:hypothetical protein